MKTQHFLAAAAAFVLIFIMDWLWYGMLMKDFFSPMAGMRDEPDFMWLVPGTLIYCLGLVYFYDKGFGAKDQYMPYSIRFGLWATLLVWVSMGLIWMGLLTEPHLNETLIDIVFRLVQTVLAGLIIGKVLGKGGRGPGGDGGGQGDALRPPGGN